MSSAPETDALTILSSYVAVRVNNKCIIIIVCHIAIWVLFKFGCKSL